MMGWLGRRWAPVGVVVFLSAWTAGPVCASDLLTLNDTGQQGVNGGIMASPPASCTAVPGGALGDCEMRGTALMEAVVEMVPGVTYWNDNTWSDVEDGDIDEDGVENGMDNCALVPNPLQTDTDLDDIGDACDSDQGASGAGTNVGAMETLSDIGTSWLPEFCNHPQCGHLLRGDVLPPLDENGDGKVDGTWYDTNGNHIRDVGEVDRIRGEQFQWGITSITGDLGDLEDQLAEGNLFPAGLARTRVRMSLGMAGQVGGCDVPSITDPDCLDGVISSDTAVVIENKVDDNSVNGQEVDPDWWGICDPDAFDPTGPSLRDSSITTVEEGQRALDNCLWWITAMPIYANDNLYRQAQDAFDPDTNDQLFLGTDPFETHSEWIDQALIKNTFSTTTDRQDFAQELYVAYYFDPLQDLQHARYENDWQLQQQDFDPNEDVNGPVQGEELMGQVDQFGQAWSGVTAPAGPYKDTYSYAFAIQHRTIARARGYDNGETGNGPGNDQLVSECVGPDAGVDAGDCDGTVNTTVDPFWRAWLVNRAFSLDGMSFNHDFEYEDGQACDTACRISGVGSEHGIDFLTAQDVNGYFAECFGCVTELQVPDLGFHYMTYQTGWDVVPTVVHGGIDGI